MAKYLDDAGAEIEKVADAIMAAEYMLVCGGPTFDDASSDPFNSEFCVSSLVAKPNKFMGFWGMFYNEYLDKVPHDGYNILSRFREKLFSADDIRKRNKKTKGDIEGEEDQFLRFMVFTGHIGNSFQKCGIPDQEMMEVRGNITLWQCGASPICCPRTFGIERGFKFYIDPLTKDALPVKYVQPKQNGELKKFRQPLIDSDDEEDAFRAGIDKDVIKGASADDRARRTQRLRNFARTTRLTSQIQLLDHRFPDLFTGFVSVVGGQLEAYTFDTPAQQASIRSAAAYAEAQRRAADEASAEATNADGSAKKKADAPPPPVVKHCADPPRCSHLLAHTNAIDRGMYASRMGSFNVIDPAKWKAERDAAFIGLTKSSMSMESHSISFRREKLLRYNISLSIVSDEGVEGGRPYVLPPALRTRLLRPYPQNKAADEETAVNDLTKTEMKDWTQSMHGWYYFSHVPLSRTQQEPLHNTYSDVVKVDVPPPTFEGGYQLPTVGKVSLVCELAMLVDGEHNPNQAKAAAAAVSASVPPNPYTYTNNVWQFVGHIDTTNTASQFQDPKGAPIKDAFEYILEGRKGHVLHIGSLRSKPQSISYIHLEIPHNDWDQQPFAGPTHLNRPPRDQSEVSPSHTSPNMDPSDLRRGEELVPTLNHILCQSCREIARPHVLMSKPNKKDDGFATAAMSQRNKTYKAWEKSIVDALKQDQNKSIVILEVGADRKMDPSRAYSEKTYKLLKTAKCTFVRLCNFNLETKGKPAAENPNSISILGQPIASLQALERAVNERIKKITK